jgi:predicted dehydrogenase
MTDRVLKWGLLSTARINRALIPPLHASKRTSLRAVASRSESAARDFAREHNIPRAYGSYESLLADPEVDVIYNPLPNHLHAEWTIKALRAGKHVLCEKPLACSLEEVDAIIAASKETGKILAEAFMYRSHPQTMKVKEMVDKGALGQLQLIKGAFTFLMRREGDFRLVKEMGGGSIWDVGCYPVSYARMIAGEPSEVFGWQVSGQDGSDLSFFGQMKFANGVHAEFDCGFQSPLRSYIEIVGTEAVMEIPVPFKPGLRAQFQIRRVSNKNKIETVHVPGPELYSGEVEDLCDAILLNKPPRVPLNDSRANAAALLALLKSAETGKPVRL